MDPITGLPPTGPLTRAGPRAAARGGGFSVADSGATPASVGTNEAEHVAEASLGVLLALQEAATGGGDVRDRAARRRGHDLLAELAALQRAVLAGDPGEDRLSRLADLAEQVPEAADPRLRDVLAAIALRARVEVARYASR
jgi:hypothetical protein